MSYEMIFETSEVTVLDQVEDAHPSPEDALADVLGKIGTHEVMEKILIRRYDCIDGGVIWAAAPIYGDTKIPGLIIEDKSILHDIYIWKCSKETAQELVRQYNEFIADYMIF